MSLELTKHSDYIKVSGEAVELTLFYAFWQYKMWPDWMDYANLGDTGDSASRQHREAIDEIKESQSLNISAYPESRQACDYAVSRLWKLGIEVVHKTGD